MNKWDKLTDDAVRKELQEALAELDKRDKRVFEEQVTEPITLRDSFEEMEKFAQAKSNYKWPIQFLQSRLEGYWPGEMYTIGGTTGIGKSLLAAYLTYRFALDGGKALYFSTEMPHREVTRRIWRMWQSQLADKDNFFELYLEYGDNKLSITPQLIEVMLQKNKERTEAGIDRKYELIVIDNLHWFMRGGVSVADDIGIVTRAMKELALKYDTSILLVSHVNRTASKGEENKTPDMSNLKGSSYIEQDSDAVIMITRMKDATGAKTDFSVVSLEKNRRNGRTLADVKLLVDKHWNFTQYDKDPEEPIRA